MKITNGVSTSIRLAFLGLVIVSGILTIIASAPPPRTQSTQAYYPPPTPKITTYKAVYQISLMKVERPEKASNRYGPQRMDAVTTDKKRQIFI